MTADEITTVPLSHKTFIDLILDHQNLQALLEILVVHRYAAI